MEDKKQRAVCFERYRRRDEEEKKHLSDIDIEREEECGICMEINSKIVLPNCGHAMCMKCFREWYHFLYLNKPFLKSRVYECSHFMLQAFKISFMPLL